MRAPGQELVLAWLDSGPDLDNTNGNGLTRPGSALAVAGKTTKLGSLPDTTVVRRCMRIRSAWTAGRCRSAASPDPTASPGEGLSLIPVDLR